MRTSALRKLFAASLGMAVLLPTLPVSAQTTPPPKELKPADVAAPAPEGKKDDEPIQLEKIEVTGTRLRTLGDQATAVPVFSIPQLEIEHRGVTRLADIRWAIPQLAGAVGFNDNLTNSGTSRAQTVSTSFNLRGLGGNSTLILVDGRRVPHTGQEAPGGAGGREDFSIDGLPISAIERIDVLPQGAGAIYGSEAIAGVINVILKKNYTGGELRLTYDNTFDTDVAQTTVSLTGGYRSGKLSTFLTASFEDQNGLAARDRWFSSTYDSRKFGSTSTNFLFNNTSGAGSLSTAFSPATGGTVLLPGTTTHVVLLPAGSNGTTAANSAYAPTNAAGVPLNDGALYATSIDPAKRQSLFFRADYQLLPRLQLYGDLRWSEFENNYTGTPIALTTALPVGAPGNPFPAPLVSGPNGTLVPAAVYLSKVFYDLPRPRIDSFQRNLGGSFGARGEFLDTWRYDVSAAWSRNVVEDDQLTASGFNFGLLGTALASGTPPILAYDSATTSDPNAPGVLAALLPFADHKDTTDVYQYIATVDGSVWSGWAGDFRAAAGVEASEEKVKFWREPSPATPTYVLTKPFSRKYTAVFAEVGLPLLSEKQKIPLVHLLEIGGAVRATDYSDIGGVTTPTYRALFQPVKWLTLRASRSEGFKPVRLYDLQAPVTSFTQTISSTTTIRDPLRGNLQVPAGTYTYRSGGNSALNPETSVSRNAGVVLDVPGKLFKGLSFSADYYELEYSDRSGSTGLQILLNYFPDRVTRAALTPADAAAGYTGGVVQTWDASNINLASVTTKGWDYRVSYSRTFGFGEVLVTAAMSDPDPIFTKATPAATPTNTFGYQPRKFSGSAFFGRGAWDVGTSVNYQDRYFINGLTAASYPPLIEWNPQVSYNFGKDARFGAENKAWWSRMLARSKLTLTVINVFDRDPAVSDVANGRVIMDPRLRRYILSLNKKF
jgi:iron complex outermembrane receptor protein